MIRVDVDGRGWQTLGADIERGIEPTGVSPAWDAWGSASLTFSIARDPSRPWPDLAAATPIDYVPPRGGERASWGGYINETPAAGDAGLTVNARGWQYALDDDPYVDTYVVADSSRFQDVRSLPGSYLHDGAGGWTAAGGVQAGAGELSFGWEAGAIVKTNAGIGVYIDLGPDSRGAKAVAVNYAIPQLWGTVPGNLYVRGTSTPTGSHGSGGHDDGGGPFGLPAGPQTATAVYATPKRYVLLFVYSAAGGGVAGIPNDHIVKITSVRIFTDDTYRAGGASVLKASQVVTRALTRAPALDQDPSLIGATAYPIAAYGGVNEPRTARQDIEQANGYHRWLARVRADRRLEYRARFGNATLEVNTRRSGVDWQDASPNSLEDVWNGVTVRGRTGSGAELAVTRTSADVGIRNVLDRRGRKRTKTLEVAAPTDAVAMALLADVWLTRYARTPLRGTLTITGPEALRELGSGAPVPPGYAGERTGELVLLSNLGDPDTGAHGREAVTAGATYDEGTDVATLAIDNTRDDLEALLARMGVVAGAN